MSNEITAEVISIGDELLIGQTINTNAGWMGDKLGLSGTQVFRHVVLFPAVRIVYPALTSQFVLVMLATSVVSQISTPDLFHVASIIQSRTFRDFEIYAVVAGIYLGGLVFQYPIGWVSDRMDRRGLIIIMAWQNSGGPDAAWLILRARS